MKLEGTITALVTPFINQEIDEEGFVSNIQHQISAGINGILLLGSTGESATLSPEEQTRLIKLAVNEGKGKVSIWVGTGTNCTRQTIEKTKRAKGLGADVAMIVTPYYNKPTQDGIYRHFEAIAESCNIPIVIYNIPSRCGINIEPSTMARLASIHNVIGVKESSGNINQTGDFLQAVENKYPHFHLFSGDDSTALPMIALGAVGLISVVSNLIPGEVIGLVKAALEGKFHVARAIHRRLLPLYKAAFLETNPVPIKTAMQICGMPSGNCRLPLYQMGQENYQILHQLLMSMGYAK